MAVQAGCAACGKKYRVDDKFIGKKIRCKNCQGVISVEGEAVAAAAAPVSAPAKPKAKTPPHAVKKRPSSGGGGQGRSAPKPEALDLPDLSGLDVPSGPTIQLDEEDVPSGAAADAGCPGCGEPLPAANRVCMNCGYNRASGQRAKTQVEKSSMVSHGARGSDRDSSGTRIWRAYENPFLNFLDTNIPRIALILFLGMGAAMVVAPAAAVAAVGGGFSMGLIILMLILVGIYLGLFWAVTLKITMYGVKLAATMFKFEVPEDGRERLLGMVMVGSLFAAPVGLIGYMVSASAVVAAGGGVGAIFGALVGTLIVSLLVYLAVSFACFMLLFHMKVLEAIPGYLLTILFYFIGTLASGATTSIISGARKGILAGLLHK